MTHFCAAAAEGPSSPRGLSVRGSWRKLVNASEGELLEAQGEFLLQIPSLRCNGCCSYPGDLGEFFQKRPDQKKLVNPIHEVPSGAC